MTARFDAVVVTCEHASRAVPRRWAHVLPRAVVARAGHAAVDIGAAPLARRLADALDAPLFTARATRLLVDLNRSVGHPRLWSPWTRTLPADARAEILATYYEPYRHAVAEAVARGRRGGATVLHVSVHSFTPVLDGDVRDVDLALLYDPGRRAEKALARAWLAALRDELPELRVRANAPYRGTSDGHTTALRRRFADERYLGVEIEVNQALVATPAWRRVGGAVVETLHALSEVW